MGLTSNEREKPVTPYPTSVDVQQYLTDAIAFFRGEGDKAAIVHHSWEVVGFAANKYLPYNAGVGATPDPEFAHKPELVDLSGKSHEEIANKIEKEFTKLPKGTEPGDFKAPDWQRILALALQVAAIIQKLFLNNQL